MRTTRKSMGIGELARTAGVSTQHCRDLEAAGVLPGVERTPGGHRRFTDGHVLALRAYETLAAGYGFGRAHRILTLVNGNRVDEALECVDERHATIGRQRAETRTALAMLREADVGEGSLATASRSARDEIPREASIGDVAALLGVSVSTVRHWEGEGLVAPARDPRNGYRRFRRRDVVQLRVVRMLRDAGYTIEQVREVVELLGREGPDRACEIAERRLLELAHASRAALAGDSALWDYLDSRGAVDVRPVGPHILYG